jgi:hypothetical protein
VWRGIYSTGIKALKVMILRFFFNHLSLENKVKYLHKKGVGLGSRLKDGRQIHMYMLRNLFVEVMYVEDKTYMTPEKVNVLNGLNNLHQYLESEFKSRF